MVGPIPRPVLGLRFHGLVVFMDAATLNRRFREKTEGTTHAMRENDVGETRLSARLHLRTDISAYVFIYKCT